MMISEPTQRAIQGALTIAMELTRRGLTGFRVDFGAEESVVLVSTTSGSDHEVFFECYPGGDIALSASTDDPMTCKAWDITSKDSFDEALAGAAQVVSFPFEAPLLTWDEFKSFTEPREIADADA